MDDPLMKGKFFMANDNNNDQKNSQNVGNQDQSKSTQQKGQP
jgi:hypothetical protein